MSKKTKNKNSKIANEEKICKRKDYQKFWPGNKHGMCWTVKKTLHLVQHGLCFYCLEKIPYEGDDCTIDHIIPKCFGGTRTFDNVVLSCAKCNNLKGDCEVNARWVKERLEYFCRGAKGDPWPGLS